MTFNLSFPKKSLKYKEESLNDMIFTIYLLKQESFLKWVIRESCGKACGKCSQSVSKGLGINFFHSSLYSTGF